MATDTAPAAARRIMDALADRADVTVHSWVDFTRTHPADISGWADDQAAESPQPAHPDAAVVHLSIGRLTLNAETGTVRWWLEVERENAHGFLTFEHIATGETADAADIDPIVDAIGAAVTPPAMTTIGETAAKDLIKRGKSAGVGPLTMLEMFGLEESTGLEHYETIANATADQVAPVEALITERTHLLERVVTAMRKAQVINPGSYWDAYKRKYKNTDDLRQAVEALEDSQREQSQKIDK